MCSIVQIIGPYAKEFTSEIVDVITTYWNFSSSHTVQRNCIRLAGVTAKAIKTDFRASMPRLVPCILRSLKQESVDENLVAVIVTNVSAIGILFRLTSYSFWCFRYVI